MTAAEDAAHPRRAADLADTPGAVPVLATLHSQGGSATRDALERACADVGGSSQAVRWLVAVGLVRHTDRSDTDRGAAFVELTEMGARLTQSLTALADALAEPDGEPCVDAACPP